MITLSIIGITVVVSLFCLSQSEWFHRLEFSPYLMKVRSNQHYRFVSHAFVHADFMHLFFNMYVLYAFGRSVEMYYAYAFGGKAAFYFVLLYLGGVLFSSLPAIRRHSDNPFYNAVGASGAVSAVLFAAILFNPMSKIYIMFIPIGIPAFVFGILYLALEYYLDKRGGDHVAHDAHYWGAAFGFLFTIVLQPSLALRFVSLITGI